jgi:hypothetical protein
MQTLAPDRLEVELEGINQQLAEVNEQVARLLLRSRRLVVTDTESSQGGYE